LDTPSYYKEGGNGEKVVEAFFFQGDNLTLSWDDRKTINNSNQITSTLAETWSISQIQVRDNSTKPACLVE